MYKKTKKETRHTYRDGIKAGAGLAPIPYSDVGIEKERDRIRMASSDRVAYNFHPHKLFDFYSLATLFYSNLSKLNNFSEHSFVLFKDVEIDAIFT